MSKELEKMEHQFEGIIKDFQRLGILGDDWKKELAEMDEIDWTIKDGREEEPD